MQKFFITRRPLDTTEVIKGYVHAEDALSALQQVGWPETTVFTLYQYFKMEAIDALLAANPAQKILGIDAWEEKYGPAKSNEFLWVEVKTDTMRGRRHPKTVGRYSIRLCALTGHVRWPSIGEYYGNWINPEEAPTSKRKPFPKIV